MGTSRSSFEVASHLIGAVHMGDKPTTAAELAISGIGVPPYHGIRDEGTCICGGLDCPSTGEYPDISLAPRSAQRDLRSGSREPERLLLLSRDLNSIGRDLHSAVCEEVEKGEAQKVLPGFNPPVTRAARKRRRQVSIPPQLIAPEDDYVRTYIRRLSAHGAAAKGISAYRYQLRSTVRAASQISNSAVVMTDLFRDASLLGRALVDDRSTDGPRLSKWTLAQRRSAIRSFANLMRPELIVLLGEEPASVVDRALRSVAERIGAGYQLTGGAPRRRGGRAPSRDEIIAVLRCLGSAPDFTGPRNRAFFSILAATGCRVNALRHLDGTNCLVLPNGRLRIYLHEKGKVECREIELSSEVACDLMEYTGQFNRLAASRLWQNRVHLGSPEAVWRNNVGSRWGYTSVLQALKDGCTSAGVPEFAPHALRRAFASEAASLLPRHVVALAGGWEGLDRLDDHYVQAHETAIWEKLNPLRQDNSLAPTETEMNDASVIAI